MPEITRSQIVETVRSYLGTPFQHQGRLKESGVDCVGLLVCLGRDLGVELQDSTAYRRRPDGTLLQEMIDAQLERIPDDAALQPGDILLIRYRAPQHAAIVTNTENGVLTCVHAIENGVVEHRFDSRWTSRICGRYRIPGVIDG